MNMPLALLPSSLARVVGVAVVSTAFSAAGCDRKTNEAAPGSGAPSAASASPSPSPPPRAAANGDAEAASSAHVEIDEVRIRPGAATKVHVAWNAPPGTAVNADAPFRVRWNRSDGLAEPPSDVTATGSSVKDGFRIDVKPTKGASNPTLGGEINLVVCDSATHVVCVPVRRSLELGFVVVDDAAAEAKVSVPLPEARAN